LCAMKRKDNSVNIEHDMAQRIIGR